MNLKMTRLCAAFVILFSGWNASAYAGEPLMILFNSRPPYMEPDNRGGAAGLTADVVSYAFRKSGLEHKWAEVPSKRQLLMLQENAGRYAAVGWFRNPEREKFAKYSHVIYTDRKIVVLSRKDNARVSECSSLDGLLSDRSLILLVKLGYSYGTYIDGRISSRNPRIQAVPAENIDLIRMIAYKRADYMFIAPEETTVVVAGAGLRMEDFQQITLNDMPPGEKRYLLFSRAVSDGDIRRLNRYIDEYLAAHRD